MAEVQPEKSEVVNLKNNTISTFKITEQDWEGNDVVRLRPGIPGYMVPLVVVISKHDEPHVSVKVRVNNGLKEKVKVDAKVILKSSDGKAVCTVRCDQMYTDTPDDPDATDGWDYWIIVWKAVEIHPDKLYDQGRSFFVDVDVTIEVESLETQEVKRVEDYSLGKDLKTINREDYSDFVIRVDGRELKCHKSILSARSNYFKAMFASGNTLEARRNYVDVVDVSAKAIENVLKYIYTGEVPSEVDLANLEENIEAANMYLLDGLKAAYIKHLVANLNINTCLPIFVLLDKYLPVTSPERKDVLQFIMCQAAEVLELEEWADLVKKFPDLSIELTTSLAKMMKCKEKHCCQHCVITCKAS